ncbi:MAG TPA: DUF4333 domain-containing protein [Pseudonocardia sp.]|nr:DUF4333 domain-containing protein [Pseudonocardia sp.]
MKSPMDADATDEPLHQPEDSSEADSTAPSWVLPAGAVVVVATALVLGFFWPGFFVTKVFDRRALETGVRSVLVDSYRVPKVTDVYCPAEQAVNPGRSFACIAQIDGSPTQVRVLIRDDDGQYLVNRPN